MIRVRDHFRNLSNKLIADSKVAGATEHAVTTGKLREIIVQDFLKPLLPRTFEIHSGVIIDSEGYDKQFYNSTSNQQDCVIVDTRLPLINVGSETEAIIIAESVVGIIEIKSFLNKDNLFEILSKTISVKKLVRHGTQEYHKGNAKMKFKPFPIPTYVLAYDGNSIETLFDHIETFAFGHFDGEKHPASELPNAICVLNKGVLLVDPLIPIVNGNDVILPSYDKLKLREFKYSKDALFTFYRRLYTDITYTKIMNFDIDAYYSDKELE